MYIYRRTSLSCSPLIGLFYLIEENLKVNFFTIIFYIAYMQSLNMHLFYTSFAIVVILTSCNSHFLICFLSTQNIISLVFPFLLKTFLKTKAQKTPGKKRPQLNYNILPHFVNLLFVRLIKDNSTSTLYLINFS